MASPLKETASLAECAFPTSIVVNDAGPLDTPNMSTVGSAKDAYTARNLP